MHHPTDRIAHTTAFVTPVVEHWLEREIAQLWRCRMFLWCVLVDVWIVRFLFIAFPKKRNDNFGWIWRGANIPFRPTMIESVHCISFQVWTVLIASIKRYHSWVVVADTYIIYSKTNSNLCYGGAVTTDRKWLAGWRCQYRPTVRVAGWRCQYRPTVGVAGWRCQYRPTVGVAGWRCQYRPTVGVTGWRCKYRPTVGVADWRCQYRPTVGVAGWRCQYRPTVGVAGWRCQYRPTVGVAGWRCQCHYRP